MAGIGALTIYTATVLFSLLMLGLYILGAARYITNLEENTCDMTYIFEYPQYVRITMNEEIEERYPRYGLYAYGEGFVTEKHRRMRFTGIPVLFVPGNAGSHEQVRSLASVSLRKSIKDRTPYHFDYFTVSLGKDYSALYGGVLEDETTYVSLCISKIQSLYKENVNKIVLIGHSMGGIVAKGALLHKSLSSSSSNLNSKNESAANILVTLASPHRPIFLPDRTIARYYENIESLGKRWFNETNTILVSVGGGRRDILVSASQTFEPTADLNIVSSGVPTVWKTTDHLCILWCKQLVISIVGALFDCVDAKARPPKITSEPGAKIRALTYHFTSRIFGKKASPYVEKMKFERGGEWIEDPRPRYTWSANNNEPSPKKTVYLMIRIGNAAIGYDSIGIEAINLESRDWLYACSAYAIENNSRVCEWGWNLTNRTILMPDPMLLRRRTRKSVDIRLDDLRGWKISHIVVRIPLDKMRDDDDGRTRPIKIHVDTYKRDDRTFYMEDRLIPGTISLLKLLPIGRIFTPNPYTSVTTSRGDTKYRVVLTGIEDAVSVEIETRRFANDRTNDISQFNSDDEPPQATIELIDVPLNKSYYGYSSSNEVRTMVVDNKKNGEFVKKRLVMYLTRRSKDVTLKISLQPEYSYKMVIRRAGIVDRIACSIRDRWPIIYPIIVSLCLLGIAARLDASSRATAITIFISLFGVTSLDVLYETFVALGLLHVAAITACFLVIFSGSVSHNITTKFLARIVSIPNSWFDWLLRGFDRLPILTTFVLLSLISATCGAIAVLLSVPLYFLKLTRMYEDYLEELFMASLRHFIPRLLPGGGKRKRKRQRHSGSTIDNIGETPNDERSAMRAVSGSEKLSRETLVNNLLLFVTLSFAAMPAIPSALVWAKNFRYETRLTTEDPVMLASWLVLTCWGSLGYVEIPTSDLPHRANRRKLCANALRLTAWSIAFAATMEDTSAYRQWIVPPLVTFAVSCLALLALFPGDFVDGGHSESST